MKKTPSRILSSIAVIAAITGCTPSPEATGTEQVREAEPGNPRGTYGEYGSVFGCSPEANTGLFDVDDGREKLRITPSAIRATDLSCVVKRIVPKKVDQDAASWSVSAECASEGDEWTSEFLLTEDLKADTADLIDQTKKTWSFRHVDACDLPDETRVRREADRKDGYRN